MSDNKKKMVTEEEFNLILNEYLRSEWIDELVETRKEFQTFEKFKSSKIREATKLIKETLEDMELVFEGDEAAKAKDEVVKEAKLRQDFQFAIQAGFQGNLADYKKVIEKDVSLEDNERIMTMWHEAKKAGIRMGFDEWLKELYEKRDQEENDSDPDEKENGGKG